MRKARTIIQRWDPFPGTSPPAEPSRNATPVRKSEAQLMSAAFADLAKRRAARES